MRPAQFCRYVGFMSISASTSRHVRLPPTEPELRLHKWLTLAPLAAVGLLIAGGGLTPKGLDKPITSMRTALAELPIAATHADRLYLANTLIFLGLGILALAFIAIATLSRGRRGSAVASWGAGVGVVACFCGALVNVLVGLDLAGAAQARTTQDAAARVLVSTNTAFVSYVLLVAYLGGLAVASVLTGIGLWRGRRVSRWVAVGFPISVAFGGAAPPGPINVLLSIPLAVIMATLATEIWHTAPPTPRRPNAPMQTLPAP